MPENTSNVEVYFLPKFCTGLLVFRVCIIFGLCSLLFSCSLNEGSQHRVFSKRKHLKGHYYHGLRKFQPGSITHKSNQSIDTSHQNADADILSLVLRPINTGMSYHYIADTAYIPTPSACHKKTRLKGMDSVRATATDSVAFKNELIKQFEKKRNTFQYFGIASLIGYLVLSVLLEIGVFAWILPLKILLLLGVFFFLFLALRMSNKIKKLRNELYPKRKPEDTENDATKKPVKKRSYFNKALLIPIFSVLLLASLVLTGFLIMQWLSLGDGVADVFVSMFIFTFAAMSIALNITLLTALLMFIFHKNPEKEKN